jgi:hypothetical protein
MTAPKGHTMPDNYARRLALALNQINDAMAIKGRCVECGTPNVGGCDCWLQEMFNCVPMSIIHLMAELDEQAAKS